MPSAGQIRAGSAYVELFLRDTPFVRGLNAAEKHLRDAGQSMSAIGKKLLSFAGVGIAGGIFSGKAFASLEQELADLRAAANPTAEEFAAIEMAVQRISKATGTGPQAVAAAFTELLKAGTDVKTAVGGAAEAVVMFAKVSKMDAAEAAVIVSDALHVFKKDNLTAAQAVDILSASADASSISLKQIAESFAMSASVAGASQMSLKDLAIAIGIMGNAGLKGSDAGTALKTMLLRLKAPADEGAEAIARYGIEVRDATGELKSMPEIIAELNAKLGGLGTQTRDAALGKVFGADAIRPAIILMSQGVAGWEEFSKKMEGGNTIAQKFGEVMDTTSGRLDRMMAAITRLAASAGETLAGAINKVTDLVTKYADSLGDMDGRTAEFVGKAAGMTALLAAAGTAMLAGSAAAKVLAVGIKGIVGAMILFEGACKAVNIALAALGLSPTVLVVRLVAAAVAVAVIAMIDWEAVLKRVAKGLYDLTPSLNEMLGVQKDTMATLTAEQATLKAKAQRLVELREKTKKTTDEMAEEVRLSHELAGAFPSLTKAIEDLGKSAEKSATFMEAIGKALAKQQIDAQAKEVARLTQELAALEQQQAEARKAAEELPALYRRRSEMGINPLAANFEESEIKPREALAATLAPRSAEIEARRRELDSAKGLQRDFVGAMDPATGPSGPRVTAAPQGAVSGYRYGTGISDAITADVNRVSDFEAQIYQRIHQAKIGMIEDELKRELESIDARYAEEERRARAAGKTKEELAADLAAIEKGRQAERDIANEKAKRDQDKFNADMQSRIANAGISTIENDLDRELASIEERYNREKEQAKKEGKDTTSLDQAKAAEIAAARERDRQQKDRAGKDLDYQIKAEQIRQTKFGPDREMALLDLERAKAIEEARKQGFGQDYIDKLNSYYDLQKKGAFARNVRGPEATFSAVAAQYLGMGTSTAADRTANATEQTAKNTAEIIKKIGNGGTWV